MPDGNKNVIVKKFNDIIRARLHVSDVDVQEEKVVWNGFFKMHHMHLRHKKHCGGWSDVMSREVLHRGDAAAAIVYDPKLDAIGLVEQFRMGSMVSEHGPWCLEVVAGMIEKDEMPDEVILRELEEEAGIKSAKLLHITDYYSTPGGCSEKIHLFCAVCDLSNAEGLYGLDEENEDIYFHVVEAESVFAGMLKERVNNAATLIGLLWLQQKRPELLAERP